MYVIAQYVELSLLSSNSLVYVNFKRIDIFWTRFSQSTTTIAIDIKKNC